MSIAFCRLSSSACVRFESSLIVSSFIVASIGFDRDHHGLHADGFNDGGEAAASLATATSEEERQA